MKFIADFHIHSHYSRATSKKLDLPNIYKAAQIKGINLVGTGDFTHPGWFSELSENLVPAEQGLYALKPDLASLIDKDIPKSCLAPVRFVLTAEISNIYKKNGRTRKNHNVLFLPHLDAVQSLNGQLDRIGNIHSDGRPIF
jgi:PHP family Zn ribbon phosphoesterase